MDETAAILEQQMMREADALIDRAIPRGGLSTFGEPGGASLFGLGLEQRLTASFGVIEDRLNAPFGSLGAITFKKFTSAVKGILGNKKAKAKAALPRVAAASKQAMSDAAKAKIASDQATNVVQKERLLGQAKDLVSQADKYKAAAQTLAKESIAPTITRAEAKAAMAPIVKQTAQTAAQAGKNVIKQIAVAKPSSAWGRLVSALKPGVGPMARKGMAGQVGTFLSMGDIDTATQDMEPGDITENWNNDDIYGDPLGF